ncbi:TA system toxin CbtA family protein, partial [Escherichia coli]|uniref:TA system toxin CbtA family protein n=1 Tax=Escherichia coli TaxID=562 RepID=UPI001FCEBFE4
SLKTSIKTITYLSDIGCLEIQGASLLCDAVNFLVEKYALVRTDQPGFSACTRSQLINSIDILRARRATGLMARDNYRTVNNITLGKHPGAKQ